MTVCASELACPPPLSPLLLLPLKPADTPERMSWLFSRCFWFCFAWLLRQTTKSIMGSSSNIKLTTFLTVLTGQKGLTICSCAVVHRITVILLWHRLNFRHFCNCHAKCRLIIITYWLHTPLFIHSTHRGKCLSDSCTDPAGPYLFISCRGFFIKTQQWTLAMNLIFKILAVTERPNYFSKPDF